MEQKQRIKYKYKDTEIDLSDYINNLDRNVQEYSDRQGWGDSQKQEFRRSYEQYLKGFKDQLANNTSRFSTNVWGGIVDSTGALTGRDDDDIDLNNSEYYYDNKGNRITTDDYNLLKDKQKKNFGVFKANEEVWKYLNWIAKHTVQKMESAKTPTNTTSQKAFDLDKNGFIPFWETTNNPSKEAFNWAPYIEKDAIDPETGVRSTSARAEYLRNQLEEYKKNLGEYDFSSTPFKSRETYLGKLDAAINNLANGYNSEDTIALNQAGIGNEFLNNLFGNSSKAPMTETQRLTEQNNQAQKQLNELEELKKQKERAKILEAEKFFMDNAETLALKNPYYGILEGDNSFNSEKWWRDNDSKSDQEIRNYINLKGIIDYMKGQETKEPSSYNVFPWNQNIPVSTKDIANRLTLAIESGIIKDKIGDSYIIPGSENSEKYSVLTYNPTNRSFEEKSVLANEELKKRMAYNMYNSNIPTNKQGGILEARDGLALYRQGLRDKWKSEKTPQKENNRTVEQIERDQAPHTKFSKADMLRLGAIGGDVASLVASMTGVGSVASAGIGMASTAANQAADMEEGMGFLESLGNNAVSYGLDALSLIPFARAAKIPRIAKNVAGFAPKLIGIISSAQGFSNAPEIIKSLNKINNDSESLTVEDWRNIANGIQIVLGGTAAAHRASKAKSHVDAARTNDEWLKTEQGYRKISELDMKKLREAATIKEQNDILKPYNVTLAESKTKYGFGKGKGKADINSENYYYDFDKPVTTYSGDLPLQYKFGPGEKWLGTRALPSLRFPAVRNAYNRVIHPQAYKRAKKAKEVETISKPTPKNSVKTDWQLSKKRFNRAISTQNRIKTVEYWKKRYPKRLEGKSNKEIWNIIQEQQKASKNQNGGILDRVRKFVGGGITNTTSKATWFNNIFNTDEFKNWIKTFNKDNYNEFNDLQTSWKKNFDEVKYVPGMNPTGDKSENVSIRQQKWNKTGLNSLIEKAFNNGLLVRPGNSGDNAEGNYVDGYFGEQEYLRHGGSKNSWQGQEDKLKEFQDWVSANTDLQYKLNDNTGMYELQLKNSVTPDENLFKPTIPMEESVDSQDDSTPEFSKRAEPINPTIQYGLPRALAASLTNRAMTEKALDSQKVALVKPLTFTEYVTDSLQAEMEGQRLAGMINHAAQNLGTSDGNAYRSAALEGFSKGAEAILQGKMASNNEGKQSARLAWQQTKENRNSEHAAAQINTNNLIEHGQNLAKIELGRQAKNYEIWDTLAQQLEYDSKVKAREKEERENLIYKQDMLSAINNNLPSIAKQQGMALTPAQIKIWNKLQSGKSVGSFDDKERNDLQQVIKIKQQLESQAMRAYYNIPNNQWTIWNKARNYQTDKAPEIELSKEKKGGKLNTAKVRERIKNADRFQKSVEKKITRTDKAVERMYKYKKK